MSRAGAKNVLPVSLPRSNEVNYSALRIPDGPWMNDLWLVDSRPGGTSRNVPPESCHIDSCDIDVQRSVDGVALCYGHWWQWRRADKAATITAWMETGAKPVQRRQRSASNHTTPLDLRSLPEPARTEFRLVIGTKVSRGDWTPSDHLRRVFSLLIGCVQSAGATSFLDRRFEDWMLLTRRAHESLGPKSSFDGWFAPYYRTFFTTLHRALLADPWAETKWLWRGCFDKFFNGKVANEQPNIDWGSIRLHWLRDGAMTLAQLHLKSGDRTWSTIAGWRRALIPLADYLAAEGLCEPNDLSRDVFLDYLAQCRQEGASKNTLQGITTAAKILELLKADGIVGSLPTDIYLRHGENAVQKAQNPTPYPQDVIDRVDNLVLKDTEIDRTVRAMLLLLRWGCPRVSELINLPLECLQHNGEGGYWIEYWQIKTSRWRRFPIPDDLAAVLLDQQQWVRTTFPAAHDMMFPSFGRSNYATGTAQPWTGNGFREAVRKLFQKHGINGSSITGETISGGHIHRYRHTVGTTLLNNNWTMAEVQEFFAHASSTMTATYAKITHNNLAKKAKAFHEQQESERDARGLPATDPTVERLRGKFTAVLPDGYCGLPAHMKCDFRDNPCKLCSFYDPGGDELSEVHAGHRKRLTLLISGQTAAGDTAAREINERSLSALDRVFPNQEDGRL